jgi:periplasmic mercuric ion binding protein
MDEQRISASERGDRNRYRQVFMAALCALTLTGALWFLIQASQPAGASFSASVVKSERVKIAIEGMSCTSCANGIKAMLKRTPGVISAEVSFERREAVVEYDSERTSREKIVEAITKLGYKASVK